ncbi:calcium-binding protein [Phenylobacterium sp. VNQ135]
MAWLLGTGGADTLTGGAEDDLIIGHGGADQIRGGAGDDNIDLFQADGTGVLVDGEEGADTIFGRVSGTLNGGAGDDSIEVYGGQTTINAGTGDDYVAFVAPSLSTVTLGEGRDVIQGYLRAGSPAVVTDFQVGDAGDRIFIQPGAVRDWDGASNPIGLGYYRVIQQGADTVFQWDGDGPASQIGWVDILRLQNVNASQLTAWNLYGWPTSGGAPAGQLMVDSGGADSFIGDKGADTLLGGAGADSLSGGIGHDSLVGGAGNDTLFGSTGDDQFFGDDGDDWLMDTGGSNFIRGGAGNDFIDTSSSSNNRPAFNDLHGNTGDDTVMGGRAGEWVVGGQGNDLLSGGGEGDVVYGNLGNDTCYGDTGNDWVRGGQGNDSLSAGDGDDFVAGDRGSDTISGGFGADLFHAFSGVGLDRILDFNAADGDRVNLLAGTTYTLRQEGADTIVDLGGEDRVVLVGVQLGTLPAGWIFVG